MPSDIISFGEGGQVPAPVTGYGYPLFQMGTAYLDGDYGSYFGFSYRGYGAQIWISYSNGRLRVRGYGEGRTTSWT